VDNSFHPPSCSESEARADIVASVVWMCSPYPGRHPRHPPQNSFLSLSGDRLSISCEGFSLLSPCVLPSPIGHPYSLTFFLSTVVSLLHILHLSIRPLSLLILHTDLVVHALFLSCPILWHPVYSDRTSPNKGNSTTQNHTHIRLELLEAI
jgi:hypothetical protein